MSTNHEAPLIYGISPGNTFFIHVLRNVSNKVILMIKLIT
jgi:hypothetical protein